MSPSDSRDEQYRSMVERAVLDFESGGVSIAPHSSPTGHGDCSGMVKDYADTPSRFDSLPVERTFFGTMLPTPTDMVGEVHGALSDADDTGEVCIFVVESEDDASDLADHISECSCGGEYHIGFFSGDELAFL